MSEHDNPNDPVDAGEPTSEQPPVDQPATPPAGQPAAFAAAPAPAAVEKPRWRDRVFRMRAVAAVAVAGVIIGATGGAVTTALVSGDHRDHDGQHQIMRFGQPGMPAVPPDGRMRFPGDESEDGDGNGELPEMPVPPGSQSGTDGSDEDSLSRS